MIEKMSDELQDLHLEIKKLKEEKDNLISEGEEQVKEIEKHVKDILKKEERISILQDENSEGKEKLKKKDNRIKEVNEKLKKGEDERFEWEKIIKRERKLNENEISRQKAQIDQLQYQISLSEISQSYLLFISPLISMFREVQQTISQKDTKQEKELQDMLGLVELLKKENEKLINDNSVFLL